MKTYLKALLRCKVPAKLNNNWLRPIMWLHKLKLVKCAHKVSYWYVNAYNWHEDTRKEMLSHSRLFLAYDGALGEHGHGRDTDEFCQYVVDRMGESMLYFQGRIAPRVEMEIAFDDPERFPYQYVKWTTRLHIFNITHHIRKHYTWISFSVLLILIQVLTLILLMGE